MDYDKDPSEELLPPIPPARYSGNHTSALDRVEKRKWSDKPKYNSGEFSKRSKILPDELTPQEVQSSVTITREVPKIEAKNKVQSVVTIASEVPQTEAKNKVFNSDRGRVKCIPTHQVDMASRLVGQMLKIWPEASPGTHLQAAASLEKFARQVFFPYLLVYQTDPTQPMDQTRVFYATLLALREVLAQNTSTIFKIPKYDDNPASKNSSSCDSEDEKEFIRLLMATTVVVNACDAAGMDSQELMALIEKDDFPVAKPFGNTVEPNGRRRGEYEALAWKVGYNLAKQRRLGATLPLPTSCWISIVEQVPEEKLEKIKRAVHNAINTH